MSNMDNSQFKIEYISTSGVYKIPFTLVILLQLFFGGMILVVINFWFVNQLYFLLTGNQFFSLGITGEWYYWLLLPLNLYGNVFLFAFSIILFSAGINKILNKVYPILHPYWNMRIIAYHTNPKSNLTSFLYREMKV